MAAASVYLIKTADRVFECTHTPLGGGLNTLGVRVVSGPPLTPADGDRITAAVVAELVGIGCDVRGWECVPKEQQP